MQSPYAQSNTPDIALSPEHASPEHHENNHDGKKKEESIMKSNDMQQPITTHQDNSPEKTPLENSFSESEAVKVASVVVANLRTGLEQSETKATDVTTAVDQVVKLSGRDQYQKAIDAIFNDPTLSTEEKLRLKAEEDSRQDTKDDRATDRVIKLQSSQKSTIVELMRSYGGIVFWSVSGVSVLFLCGTPTGRVILNKAVTWAIKEGPQIVQETVV